MRGGGAVRRACNGQPSTDREDTAVPFTCGLHTQVGGAVPAPLPLLLLPLPLLLGRLLLPGW